MLNQEVNTTEKIWGMSYRPPPVRRCASKLPAEENPTALDTRDYNKSQKLLPILASPYQQGQSGNGRIDLEKPVMATSFQGRKGDILTFYFFLRFPRAAAQAGF